MTLPINLALPTATLNLPTIHAAVFETLFTKHQAELDKRYNYLEQWNEFGHIFEDYIIKENNLHIYSKEQIKMHLDIEY